jgi:hypothetical protein
MSNIEGNWKMAIDGESDKKSAICTLIQAENTLTGTFRGPVGHLAITGTVMNNQEIIFSAKFILGDLMFFGTADGSTMMGVVDLPMGKGRKKWTAIKLIDAQNS